MITYSFIKKIWNSSSVENELEELVFKSFSDRIDFVIPKNDYNKRIIFLRYWIKTVILFFKEQFFSLAFPVFNLEGRVHMCSRNGIKNLWNEHISKITKEKNLVSVSFEDIKVRLRLLDCLRMLSYLIRVLLMDRRSFSKVNNYLLIPDFIYLLFKLVAFTEENKIRAVFFSDAYFPYVNILSFLLLQKKVDVSFFVSGTPLSIYLSQMYASKIYFSNAYQVEEFQYKFRIRKSIVAHEVFLSGPMLSPNFDFNESLDKKSDDFIGIYTSGFWKRIEKNSYYDILSFLNEERIIKILDEFITKNPNKIIMFFLHPVEKQSDEDFEKAKNHYLRQIVNKKNIVFANRSIRTTENFRLCDMAVTSISNTLFERLFAGYKTVVFRSSEQNFPESYSALLNISFQNLDGFEMLLQRHSNDLPVEFFDKSQTQAYCKFYGFDSDIPLKNGSFLKSDKD